MPCHCSELILSEVEQSVTERGWNSTRMTGKRRLHCPDYPGARHDCREVARRNTFIAQAEREALQISGPLGSPGHSVKFTRAFSIAMERLCKIDPSPAELDAKAAQVVQKLSQAA